MLSFNPLWSNISARTFKSDYKKLALICDESINSNENGFIIFNVESVSVTEELTSLYKMRKQSSTFYFCIDSV